MLGPGAYLLVIHKMYKNNCKSHAKALPYLLVYSIGMSVNNTVAVFDGAIGKKNEFLRTPKYGIIKNDDDWRGKAYNLPFTKTTLLELFFAVYGILGIFIAIFSNNPIFAPIIGLQAVGFFYIAWLSFSHTRYKRPKFSDHKITRDEKMANYFYKLALGGIFAIIVIGGYMAFVGYSTDVYPLDISVGLLDRTMASADPQSILVDLKAIKENLPVNGNPVWIFPTDTTNFARIQTDLNVMIVSAEKITAVPTDSAAYHTGITDIRERANVLQENLADAIPYMYVSFSNIIFSSIWIAALLAIFAVLNKKKQQMKEYDFSKDV